MTTAAVTHLPNIQTEELESEADARFIVATPEDVDLFTDNHSEGIVVCRERGRHFFPTIRQGGLSFSEYDQEEGVFIRRVECPSCRCAIRVERWESIGKGKNVRMRFVYHTMNYCLNSDGENYLSPPGHGRMTSRAVRESVASAAMKGQSMAALRKALVREQNKKEEQ